MSDLVERARKFAEQPLMARLTVDGDYDKRTMLKSRIAGIRAGTMDNAPEVQSALIALTTFESELADAKAREEYRKQRIAELVEDGAGFWRACSGCQESVDGCVSYKDYPRNPVFQCQPGSGCRECGGIGVIWDDADYDAYARAALAETGGEDA